MPNKVREFKPTLIIPANFSCRCVCFDTPCRDSRLSLSTSQMFFTVFQ